MQLHTLSPRRLTGVAAIACAAALMPVAALAATASATTPAAARIPACSTAGLVIWFSPQFGGGYAGGYYYDISFTNLSGHACTLRGHPGASAVNLSDGQVGSPASWGNPGNVKLRTVTLANGATATAVLDITDVGVYSPKACRQATAAGLRVYPPGQTGSKVAPYPFRACSAAQGFMTVGLVQTQK